MKEILTKINDIIQCDSNLRGIEKIDENTSFCDVMDIISKIWTNLNDYSKGELSISLLDRPDYLIGNDKWILYNYICELKTDNTDITCGNYAYYKVRSMLSDQKIIETNIIEGFINGEKVRITKDSSMIKNKIIIRGNGFKKSMILFMK